jgi:hypothetical protein
MDTRPTPHHRVSPALLFQLIITVIVRHARRLSSFPERLINEGIGIFNVQQRLHPFVDIGSENDAPGMIDGDRHSLAFFSSPYLICRKLHYGL